MHIAEVTRSVNGQSTNYPQIGIGHNGYVDFDDAIERNRQTSAYLLCREMLITAIQDRRLDRSHLKVLAAIASKMAESRLFAWPDRATIADATGMTPKSVSNVIGQLRSLGYLIVDRRDVAEAGGRNLMVYTFGNIDHETIRKVITETCRELMADRTAKQSVRRSPAMAGTSRPSGNFPSQRELSSRPSGHSNKKDIITTVENHNNRGVAPTRKVTRGSRLDPNWTLPKSWGDWALQNFAITKEQIYAERDAFRDYWLGATGAKATKADWEATWRNWIRNSRKGYQPRIVGTADAPDIFAVADETAAEWELARKLSEVDDA